MELFKNLLGKKEKPIKSYEDFWIWFQENEKTFFKTVKNKHNVQKDFLEIVQQKLDEIQEDIFYFLTGMADDNTVELIFSAEGDIKNIVYVEEIVKLAPKIDGWIFTALKPELRIEDVNIEMDGYNFNKDNIYFYPNDDKNFPDEINLILAHNDYTIDNENIITMGMFIFLDNFLGELNAVTIIDSVNVVAKNDAEKELIPIEKLKSYLLWRQKEFIEKYEGIRHNTKDDKYVGLEAQTENGQPSLAVMNSDLLQWDGKASHPWMVVVELKYDGENNNGMPDEKTYQLYNEIEDDIMSELKDSEGYLNIGRETGLNKRTIYFACQDFRKPSKVLQERAKRYGFEYAIFKDKYWRSVSHFAK